MYTYVGLATMQQYTLCSVLEFGVVVGYFTSVCQAVCAKVMSDIPHVTDKTVWSYLCSNIIYQMLYENALEVA